jgi:hypothetical protein
VFMEFYHQYLAAQTFMAIARDKAAWLHLTCQIMKTQGTSASTVQIQGQIGQNWGRWHILATRIVSSWILTKRGPLLKRWVIWNSSRHCSASDTPFLDSSGLLAEISTTSAECCTQFDIVHV